jgi:hypothetical protein
MCTVIQVCLQNHLKKGFFLSTVICIAHNYHSIFKALLFQNKKIGTSYDFWDLSLFIIALFIFFQSAFIIYHGAFICFQSALFKFSKWESVLFTFFFQNIIQLLLYFLIMLLIILDILNMFQYQH